MHISWPMGIKARVLRYHFYCGSNAKTLTHIWTAVLTYAASSVSPWPIEGATDLNRGPSGERIVLLRIRWMLRGFHAVLTSVSIHGPTSLIEPTDEVPISPKLIHICVISHNTPSPFSLHQVNCCQFKIQTGNFKSCYIPLNITSVTWGPKLHSV